MTSISFARIAGTSTTFAGNNYYTQGPSQSTGTGAPQGQDISDYFLLTVFTKPYLDAHTLSFPSWRYAYYLWFAFIGLFILWVILHQVHFRAGAVGAWWRSLAMRKISFGQHSRRKNKAHNSASAGTVGPKKGWSSPTIGQMLGLAVLLAGLFVACYVGPDYIDPMQCMFGGRCGFHPVNGDSATNQYSKRAVDAFSEFTSTATHMLHKRRLARYGWSPLTDPLVAGPNYTIDKNFWTSANRIGLIAYALLPLTVSLALKQWPFNIFATPFFVNLGIDKTAFWHRWIGRIVWILSTVHGGLWTKQLFIDINPFNEPTWNCAWKWHRLAAGGAAYIALTLMFALSFKPLRNRFYELFYYSHVLLVLVFLVTIIIHYQALQGWCLLATMLWACERIVRTCVWLWLNHGKGIPFWGEGRIGQRQFRASSSQGDAGFKVHNVEKRLSAEGQKYAAVSQPHNQSRQMQGQGAYGDEEWSAASRSTHNLHASLPSSHQPASAFSGNGQSYGVRGQEYYDGLPSGGDGTHTPITPVQSAEQEPSQVIRSEAPAIASIPRGYALAQVLPGRVLRLTLHTPRHLNWKPGQHIQLTLPSVRWWQSHPYSIVNAQNVTEAAIAQHTARSDRQGSEIVLLLSTRRGFTKRLFQSIQQKRKRLVSQSNSDKEGWQTMASEATAPQGVLIRAQTYLPAGSAARIRWDDFSTVVLVAAGSGVTYAVSVLQHLCHQMAHKDAVLRGDAPASKGKKNKLTSVTRVRFVWVFRDYAHLAWIAPALRKCLDIADPSRLRLDLFVAQDSPNLSKSIGKADGQSRASPYGSSPFMAAESQGDLFQPPAPGFARGARHGRSHSADSSSSDLSQTVVDSGEWSHKGADSRTPDADVRGEDDNDFSVTDMVLFDGEDERPTYADEEISRTIKQEGRLRRGLTRKRQANDPSHEGQGGSYVHPRPESYQNRLASLADQADLSADEGETGQLRTPGGKRHHYPPASSALRYDATYSPAETDKQSFMASGAVTPSGFKRSSVNLPLLINNEEIAQFDMTLQDKEDLSVIAELARGGKPDISKILDMEIERAQGKIAVGCCGPIVLNNHLRNMVAKRISPSKIARGDQRGNIELFTEDFFY